MFLLMLQSNSSKLVSCACKLVSIITAYQPLKLMQVVTGKVNEVCLRYRDNGKLATLPPPSSGPPISSCAIKNTRRCMEDRHVIIEDFHTVFSVQVFQSCQFSSVDRWVKLSWGRLEGKETCIIKVDGTCS
jgi:hypothetical protein